MKLQILITGRWVLISSQVQYREDHEDRSVQSWAYAKYVVLYHRLDFAGLGRHPIQSKEKLWSYRLQNVKEYCHNYLLNLQLSLLFAVDFELRHCCSFVLLYVETLCFICTRAFVSCHVDCIWLSWVAGTWHNKSNQEVISGKEGYNTCTRNFALTFM